MLKETPRTSDPLIKKLYKHNI